MALEAEAARAISSYNLNASGVPYAQQGYLLSEGYLPAWKIDEHLLIDRAAQAIDP